MNDAVQSVSRKDWREGRRGRRVVNVTREEGSSQIKRAEAVRYWQEARTPEEEFL